MRKGLTIMLGIAVVFAMSVPYADACTNFLIEARDGTLVNGRSMEFAQPMASMAVVHPRGEAVQSIAPGGKKGLAWTSKYGYVMMTSQGKEGPNDGLNEKGLSLGFLWFPETKYPAITPEESGKAVEILDFASWLLGNFATVDEARQQVRDVRVWGQVNPLLKGVPPLHVALQDATGASLVIEFADGQMNVYDNPFGVLTNSPAFPWQLTNLRNYVNLTAVDAKPLVASGVSLPSTGHGAGMLGLPADATPPSRFVRTFFNTHNAAPAKDARGAVNLALHILNAVDIPQGTDRLSAKTLVGDYTQWTVIKDLTNLVLYFRSYGDLSPKAIDLKKLDFSPGAAVKSISIVGEADAVEDVTTKMK